MVNGTNEKDKVKDRENEIKREKASILNAVSSKKENEVKREKVSNLNAVSFKKRSKLYWLVFSLIIFAALAVSGLTIWLVVSNVGPFGSYEVSLNQVENGRLFFDEKEGDETTYKNFRSKSDLTVTIKPDSGFYLYELKINNEKVAVENYGESYVYKIHNISKSYNIIPVFKVKDFARLYINHNENGVISPQSISSGFGESHSFTITPNEGFKIQEILVDGVSIPLTAAEGESQVHTFENVQTDHTISVEFVIRTFWISVDQAENGAISPTLVTAKYYNTNQKVVFTPNSGWFLDSIIIDGVEHRVENNGEVYEHTLYNITSSHSVSAVFKIREFAVKFVGYNGEIIKEESVEYGKLATVPAESEITIPEGHYFVSWPKFNPHIYEDTTIFAIFGKNIYSVSFFKDEGVLLEEKSFEYGYIIKESDLMEINPNKEGYRFTKWDKDVVGQKVTGELSFTAEYIKQWVVNYNLNGNGVTYLNGEGNFAKRPFDEGEDLNFEIIPYSNYLLKEIIINGVKETIVYDDISKFNLELDAKYLTGGSVFRSIENIQEDYTIEVTFIRGAGIAEYWNHEIIDGKRYLTQLSGEVIPAQIFEDDTFYDIYGIGNGEQDVLTTNGFYYRRFIVSKEIKVINDKAFSNSYSLLSIEFEEESQLISIGEGAFSWCRDLTSITIPNSVILIGNEAFRGCSSLTEITIPDSVISIGDNAFWGCTGLTEITIPDSVTSIGDYAFWDCTGLTSITIPDSEMSIGGYAFAACSSLTEITIPNSVMSIGEGAFNGCSSLAVINIDNNNIDVSSVFINGFYSSYTSLKEFNIRNNDNFSSEDGVLFNKDKTIIIAYPNQKVGEPYLIPSTVEEIRSKAFSYCSNLTSIIIPDSLTSIGHMAFWNCTSLTTLTFEAGGQLTSIEDYAFENCTSLTSITIPNSVTTIGSSAFAGCSSLTSLTFEAGSQLGSIGDEAFTGSDLTSITIPDSVTSIARTAFVGCSKLTEINVETFNERYLSEDGVLFNKDKTALVYYPLGKTATTYFIPSSVTSIGEFAFSGSSLTSIIIPDSVTTIGSSAFRDCVSLESITIPDGVTNIGSRSFEGCTGLTSIIIPDSVTGIGWSAFYGCSSLTEITIPDGVTSIGDYTFYGCSSLTSITIPDSVTSIGDEAFWGCTGLTSIIIPDSVTSIGRNAFPHTIDKIIIESKSMINFFEQQGESFKIFVYASVFEDYENDLNWKDHLNNIVAILMPDEDFTYNINGNELIVTNILSNYENYCIAGEYDIETEEGTMKYSVSQIGDGVNSINSSATNIYLDEGIISIADYAFALCVNLKEIKLPSSLITIGKGAFQSCISLEQVDFEEGLLTIEEAAFYYCVSLESVILPSTIIEIGGYAFADCERLLFAVIYSTNPPEVGENVFGDSVINICVLGESFADYKNLWEEYSLFISHTILTLDEIEYEIIEEYGNLTDKIIITKVNASKENYFIDSKFMIDGKIYYVQSVGILGGESVDKDAISVCFANGIEYINWGESSLVSVTILSGTIGESSFKGTRSLISVVLGKNVTAIDGSAFHANNHTIFIIYAPVPPTLGYIAFGGGKTVEIYVLYEYLNDYKEATRWSSYANHIKSII